MGNSIMNQGCQAVKHDELSFVAWNRSIKRESEAVMPVALCGNVVFPVRNQDIQERAGITIKHLQGRLAPTALNPAALILLRIDCQLKHIESALSIFPVN